MGLVLFAGIGGAAAAGPEGAAAAPPAAPNGAAPAPIGGTGPAPSAAAPPPAGTPLSLAAAIELQRRKNLRLAAGRYEVSAARADAIAAGLVSNPTLSVGAQVLSHGAITGGKEELSVMLAQRLPVTGHTGLRRDAASAAATAAEAEFAADGWTLLGELRQAYVALQLAQQKWRVLHAGLGDLDRIQHVLDERARAGATPAYDRLRLEIERGTLQGRVAEAEVVLVGARSGLARAIGGDRAELGSPLADDPVEPLSPPSDAELVQRAHARRPELRAIRFRAMSATLAARAAARRYVPEPELGVGYARFFEVPQATGSASGGAALVSLSLPLPLFDHGQGTIRGYEERGRATETLARDARVRVDREVSAAAQKLRASLDAHRTHEERVGKDVENVRRIAEGAYREGKATILELLDAYSSYLRVKEQAVELHGLALSAAVELEQAIGP